MNKRVELCKSKLSKRRMFIVDIEKAVGKGRVFTYDVMMAMERIKRDHHLEHGDHVVLGVSHPRNLFPAKAWKGARLVFKHGKDSADHCLKHVIRNESVSERFQEVVLVGGDDIFTEEIELLREAGVKVTIDSRTKSISNRLTRSASAVYLESRRRQVPAKPAAA